MPYWALSDTLPARHPLRPRSLWAWLTYLASAVTGSSVFLVGLASPAAAIVLMVVSSVFALVAIGLGVQLINAVTEDHRRRLEPA